MANRSNFKKSNGGACPGGRREASPPTNGEAANGEVDTRSAEFRQSVVQEQARSLRRRLWHAFQNEDAATALRAYKATAKDLQAWIQEEIQVAQDKEAQRRQEEKVCSGNITFLSFPLCLLTTCHAYAD